jgi:hypothetical protein
MTTKDRRKPIPPHPETVALRRRWLDLTLAEVANRIRAQGVPCATTTVWNWENGLPIPERHWTPLAKALRCSVESLRGERRSW